MVMRASPLLGAGIVGVLGLVGLLSLPVSSGGQTTKPAVKLAPTKPAATKPAVKLAPIKQTVKLAPAKQTVKPLAPPCNTLSDLVAANPPDPKPAVPPVLTPIDEENKDKLLTSGLPCAENVNTVGPPGKSALENLQRGFDFYSWRTFIALNSPADESKTILDSRPDTRAKWEDMRHFRQLLDVMLPGARVPRWGERERAEVPLTCRKDFKPGMMIIEMIEETFNQPFKTGPLIDQSGNYALFDILMNRQMFDYIVKNKLYSKQEQMRNSTLKIDFPAGENPPTDQTGGGDPGTVMLKVSWKVLDSDREKERFHNVDALVAIAGSSDGKIKAACVRKTLGMVGFHVGHKTKNRLQWIWTSFEHIDNVPEQKDVDARNLKASYSFHDPACDAEKCPVNQTPPRPWDPNPTLKFLSAFKSQITRTIPLTEDTKEINAKFQKILQGTVWANYMLLSTQWPSDFNCARKAIQSAQPNLPPNTDFEKQPDMTCAPAPAFLANSTLETYSQGSVPQASSTCMGCHGNATSYQQRPPNSPPNAKFFNQSDFTFTLEKAR
jgi:hypothetical protein